MSSHFSFYPLQLQGPTLLSFPWYVLVPLFSSYFVILCYKIPTLDNLTLHLLSTFGKVDDVKLTTASTGLLKFIYTNLKWALSDTGNHFILKVNPHDISHSKILYDPSPRVMQIETKIIKWDLIKLTNFHTANYKQGEMTTLGMGENNSKWNNWQKINLQNIQAAHETQYQKTK